MIFKDYSTLGVRYQDLQARVHEQETRNLTVLNIEFLVCERVLANPDNARHFLRVKISVYLTAIVLSILFAVSKNLYFV